MGEEFLNILLKNVGQPLWYSIISIFLSALTAGAIILYIIEYRTNKRRVCTEKAIDIAKIYTEEVLDNITYIYHVFDLAGLDIQKKLKTTDIKYFTKNELAQSELIEFEFSNIFKKISEKDKIESLLVIRTLILGQCRADSIINKIENKDANQNYLISILKSEFDILISDTLNSLEYMAMCFNTEMGDDTVVYQSLHQTFLKLIKYLYYYIARNNEMGCDKYYTNIITLYNNWNQRYIALHKREFAEKDALTSLPKRIYSTSFKKIKA